MINKIILEFTNLFLIELYSLFSLTICHATVRSCLPLLFSFHGLDLEDISSYSYCGWFNGAFGPSIFNFI
jgi:hypothetical protein